jgi:chromate transport protein ChrA
MRRINIITIIIIIIIIIISTRFSRARRETAIPMAFLIDVVFFSFFFDYFSFSIVLSIFTVILGQLQRRISTGNYVLFYRRRKKRLK